jgi:hypothetical protein
VKIKNPLKSDMLWIMVLVQALLLTFDVTVGYALGWDIQNVGFFQIEWLLVFSILYVAEHSFLYTILFERN